MRSLFTIALIALTGYTAPAQHLPSYLPVVGLTAYFPFAANAIDSTGNGHDGTMHGCAPADDRYGRHNMALRFNGASDYIYVPPAPPLARDMSIDITASLTISAWVKSKNYFYLPQSQIYWRGDPTSAHDPHMLYFIGSDVRVRRDVDPGTISNEVGTPVTSLDTNYHMFTGTYDSISGMMSIYLDGVQKSTKYLPGLETYATSTMYNYIGAVDGGTSQFFYGTMDELGIWNRALTPCEIAALYYSSTTVITKQPMNDTVTSGGTASYVLRDTVPGATYQWQVDTGTGFKDITTAPYTGFHTATLTITPTDTSMTGNKYRCVPVYGACVTDTSDVAGLVVKPKKPVTGISGKTQESYLKASPNPSNGEWQLTGLLATDEPVTIQVTNTLGQVVYKEVITPKNGVVNKKLALGTACGNGMYLIKASTPTEHIAIPLVLQR